MALRISDYQLHDNGMYPSRSSINKERTADLRFGFESYSLALIRCSIVRYLQDPSNRSGSQNIYLPSLPTPYIYASSFPLCNLEELATTPIVNTLLITICLASFDQFSQRGSRFSTLMVQSQVAWDPAQKTTPRDQRCATANVYVSIQQPNHHLLLPNWQ